MLTQTNSEHSSDTEYFVGTINQKDISAVNTGWYKTIEVEGVKMDFQLDTGAKCNIISHRVFKTLSRVSDKKMSKKMVIVKSKTNIIFWTSHQDTRDNKPHMCLQECTTQCRIFRDRNGQHSNPRC